MKTIEINTGKKYNVYVGSHLLDGLDALLPLKDGQKLLVVTDDIVDGLYSERVISSLGKKCAVFKFVFKNGEASKSIATLFEILEYCAACGLDRTSGIVALGGGVVGDISALAAALYMRGIAFFNVATTLLAMVDSSVGGKSAIDLPSGKNLVGVIRQPDAVVCDTDTLATLSEHIYTCGMAEAVKYNILYGTKIDGEREELVYECIQAKNRCVSEDELENGNRRFLNLGHTVGHAIEACSGYTVPHGIAVGAGIGVIARASHSLGLCSDEALHKIDELLSKNGLSVTFDFSPAELAEKIRSDKKASSDGVTFVLIKEIGNCILKKIPYDEIEQLLSSGV